MSERTFETTPKGETRVKLDPDYLNDRMEVILDALASSNAAAIRNREEITKLRAIVIAAAIVAAVLYVRSK